MGKPLAWAEHFAVGDEAIDRQHRELADCINEIDDAIRAEADQERVAQLIGAIRRATAEHNRHENSLLWQIKTGTYKRRSSKARPRRVAGAMPDDTFDQHASEHALSLAALDDIARAPLGTIGDMLKAWFVDHTIKYDSHLKSIFQAMP